MKTPSSLLFSSAYVRFENFSKLIFIWSDINNLYALAIGAPRHACQRNMGAELPVFRIFHPKPCWHQTHPILGCILLKHGFAWKIRNIGSSAPIFRRQSSILLGTMQLGAMPSVGVWGQKIDHKPIFRSLEQCSNLALILETVKIGEASIFLVTNTNGWYCAQLHITIHGRPQNMGSELRKTDSPHVDMCAR